MDEKDGLFNEKDGKLQVEVPKDEFPEKETQDEDHVQVRHANDSGLKEMRSLFNQKTDSEALESVYSYAKKIKSFLGLEENFDGDIACDERFVGSNDAQDCFMKEENSNHFQKLDKKNNISEIVSPCENAKHFYSDLSENSIESDSCISNVSEFVTIPGDHAHVKDFSGKVCVGDLTESSVTDCDSSREIISAQETSDGAAKENFTDKGDSSDCIKVNMNDSLLDTDNNPSADVGLDLNPQSEILSRGNSHKRSDSSNTQNTSSSDADKDIAGSNHGISDKNGDNCTHDAGNSVPPELTKENICMTNEDGMGNNVTVDQANRLSVDVVNQVIEDAERTIEKLLNKANTQNILEEIPCKKDEIVKNSSSLDANKSIENSTEISETSVASITSKTTDNLKENPESKNEKEIQITKNRGKLLKASLEYDEDTLCGIGFFKPTWLQKFATAKVYVLLYSIIGILHGSYYSYLIGTISTLEKRFAFKSKVSGTIMIADEFTPLFLGVIGGYYAGRGHRPRMVAIGMILSAGCCFVTSLPYFIYGSVQHLSVLNVKNQTGPEFCAIDVKDEQCDADERPRTLPAVLLLVLGSFMKGFGNLAYYAIGLAYMDDNSEKKDTPIFLAIALALRLLGPLVGFLMSSGFLKFYENPFEDPGYGPDDPRWIGAWWMGFVVQGVLLIIFTIPIALFPRRLPGQRKPHQQSSADGKEMWKNLFRGLLDALKRLWLNPIFVFMAINTTMKIFGRFGHAIMLPKYMENQFRLSASDASLFSGATSIFCIMVSTVTGGFLIWKYRPAAKTLLTGMIASEVTLCLGYLILMIPRCQPVDILHFGSNQDGFILNSLCNRNCDCSTTSFTPFCGPDGKSAYFSPCFAGCTLELDSIMTDKQHKEFGNCSCVADENGDLGAKITEGFCVDETCWTQTLAYICILLILVTVSNTLTVAHTIILLRSVHPNDKSVALGTFETFICLFGFIPFPVTFGALVDSACVIWEKSCGETGNCWFYDMKKYNYLLHGASSFFCSVSICCLTTLYCLSSRLKDLYKDEEPDEDQNVKLDTISGPVTKL